MEYLEGDRIKLNLRDYFVMHTKQDIIDKHTWHSLQDILGEITHVSFAGVKAKFDIPELQEICQHLEEKSKHQLVDFKYIKRASPLDLLKERECRKVWIALNDEHLLTELFDLILGKSA